MTSYQKGVAAEEQVCAFYIKHYNTVLRHQRYRTPYGEIDLILEAADRLYFVEVKMRRTTAQAAFSLRPAQQKRLANAILQFSADYPDQSHKAFQFDVALVDANAHIDIIENIILHSDTDTP